MEDLSGKQLGTYQIVEPLGEGGMASVFKAYQLGKLNRYVAIKILPKQLAQDSEFMGRFNREANVLAKLQHPRILPVFDYGEADGYTYIVMPFLESGTLADLIHNKPLPLPQVRNFIVQIAEALDYAHAQGIVHRDIKPSNVLVDERGNCLLSDFGISKILEGTQQFTSSGSIIGTPAYMSPEQGRGDTLDGRSDIYSLGIILYEMVTGRVPYKAETPLAVIFKHVQDPLPPPSSINPAIPQAIEQVIYKALAKNPDDRFQTAGEMIRAIHTAIPEATAPLVQAQPVVEAQTQVVGDMTAAPEAKPKAYSPDLKERSANKLPKWAFVLGAVALLALCFVIVLAGINIINNSVDRIFNKVNSTLVAGGLQLTTLPPDTSLSSTPTATLTPISKDRIAPASLPAGVIQGRVLFDEKPIEGATVYVTELYDFDSTHFGQADTDADGFFSISGVPEGEKYLYVFGNQTAYWVSAVTPFEMPAGKGTQVDDTYLCKGFTPISPENGETISSNQPLLVWDPFPNAVDYAVRLIPVGEDRYIFSKGDSSDRFPQTHAQVDVVLEPGEYSWRVDAFNDKGHIIGCSYYSQKFTVLAGEATSSGQSVPTPALEFLWKEESEGKDYIDYHLAISNWEQFPADLFVSAPDLPACGLNTDSSRTWVHIYNAQDESYIYGFCAFSDPKALQWIWFAVAAGETPPEAIYVTLIDRRKDMIFRSNTVNLSTSLMDLVYQSVKLEDILTDKPSYKSGEEVKVSYQLVSRSGEVLNVPENNEYSQPFYLIGSIQRWIERLGSDPTIPGLSGGRDGAKYASGGEIIPIERYIDKISLQPSESIPFTFSLDTTGYPVGKYRFYVEYKTVGGTVLQTATVDFEIR